MDRLKLLPVLIIISFQTFAQDLGVVQRFISLNDYRSAKKTIDSILANPVYQQKAAPWYYKARIYTEIVRRHENTNTNLLQEALASFKRYQQLDPANSIMKPENNVGLFQLYDLAYSNAIEHYNQQEYGMAYRNFQQALDASEYIYSKNFSFNGKIFPALDTQLLSLTGFSAYLSGNESAAIPYFEKLAALKMSGPEYKGIYTLLYQYHLKRKDAARAARYLTAGRTIFEDDDYWIRLEMGNPADAKERLERYEEMVKKYPGNYSLLLRYATEFFNEVYQGEKKAGHVQQKQKLELILQKLIQLDSTAAQPHFILSQHLLNHYYDIEELKMNEEDEAKMRSMQLQMNTIHEQHLFHAEKALKIYLLQAAIKPEEKSRCSKLLDDLVNGYRMRGDAKGMEYYEGLKKAFL